MSIKGRENGLASALYSLARERYCRRDGGLYGALCCVLPDGEPDGRVDCSCLLLPGEKAPLWSRVSTAQCAVTYGVSRRETITFSSTMGDKFVLAVQRDIRVPGLCFVESQELIIPRGREDVSLAAAGFLLLCGERPENVGRVMKEGVIFQHLCE